MLNSVDPDQAQHFVGPGLSTNCLQRSSADDKDSSGRLSVINVLLIYLSVLLYMFNVVKLLRDIVSILGDKIF